MGVRSRRSRLDGGGLLDPSARHQKARRAEEVSLDASLESSNDISSTSDDEDACTDATDLSLMSEAEVSCCAPGIQVCMLPQIMQEGSWRRCCQALTLLVWRSRPAMTDRIACIRHVSACPLHSSAAGLPEGADLSWLLLRRFLSGRDT